MSDSGADREAVHVDVSRIVEHCFRHEAGKMVSTLTRIFGPRHINLAEDVVQEALARALQTWPYYGIPENPAAWITQVSKNLALDLMRRDKTFRNKADDIARFMDDAGPAAGGDGQVAFKDEIGDDRLWMMFMCCHPLVPPEAQVALSLKTLCGFSTEEIARAFLTSEAAVTKRLTRAKRKLRDASVPYELPTGEVLKGRLGSVLETIYLLFNEGYKASEGESIIRKELCLEAVRLCGILAEHPVGDRPHVHALLSLMLLNAARLDARTDGDGNILTLREQNRSLWDQGMIARGMYHLVRSMEGREPSVYHLEASIAACHSAARDYESTDWKRILYFYDLLVSMAGSPVAALNRAVAVAEVHGPGAGIEAVRGIPGREQLESYFLLYAVLGELEERLGNAAAAAGHFRKALSLATMKSERKLLMKRIGETEAGG